MQKTTVYLPEDLDTRLAAEAEHRGVSKAHLVREGVLHLLEASDRPRRSKPLPVFRSKRARSAEEMDGDLADQIAARAARR